MWEREKLVGSGQRKDDKVKWEEMRKLNKSALTLYDSDVFL